MSVEELEKMGYVERKRFVEEKVKEFFSLVPPPAFVNLSEYIASLKNALESKLGFEITSFDMTSYITRWGRGVEIKFNFKTKEGKISSCIVKMPAQELLTGSWWSKEFGKGSTIVALKWDPKHIAVNCWM